MQGWQYGKGLIYYVIKVHPSGTTHGVVAVEVADILYTPLHPGQYSRQSCSYTDSYPTKYLS